jgi:dipeptide/tripeptide permease
VGAAFSSAGFAVLAVAHRHPYDIYIGMGLLGIGIGLAYAAMTNLVVEAVRPDQTGIATGMNTNIRNIGGALGGSITVSIIVSHLLANHLPEEHGYTVAFALCGISLAAAVVAALMVPGREPQGSEGRLVTGPATS